MLCIKTYLDFAVHAYLVKQQPCAVFASRHIVIFDTDVKWKSYE